MYDSWASHICLFIKGKKHGRMMLDSIDNGQLVYPTVEVDGQTRPKKYSKLTEAQQLQDDCDVQATNIIPHSLPPNVYALVNHQEQLRIFRMEVKHFQVKTQLLNALPPKWSNFFTEVKLAKSLYTTNYDLLYAYLSQHERHANEVRIIRERYPDPLALQEEDPIDCINKEMAFLSAVASWLQPLNNQLRTSSNPRNHATIQDGRVAVQQEKLMLAEAQEAGQILDEKKLAFIADPGIAEVQVAQQTILHNSAFQTKYLDAYDLDCDDISSDVQEMSYSEQTHIIDFPDNEITSDSNIIPYSQYLQESQDAVIQDTTSSAPNDLLVLSLVEQVTDH
ncbi:hypothetical protein Tco_0364556 [Tanacetum coccineum]